METLTPKLSTEGHSGWNIDQLRNTADESLSYRPNIILLHAGTNDLDYDSGKSDPTPKELRFSKAAHRTHQSGHCRVEAT